MSPRLTTVGAILSLVRRGAVHSVTPMGHSHAELLELELPITSKLVDKRLEEVKFPKGSLVASIINDDLVVIASGKSVLGLAIEFLFTHSREHSAAFRNSS